MRDDPEVETNGLIHDNIDKQEIRFVRRTFLLLTFQQSVSTLASYLLKYFMETENSIAIVFIAIRIIFGLLSFLIVVFLLYNVSYRYNYKNQLLIYISFVFTFMWFTL